MPDDAKKTEETKEEPTEESFEARGQPDFSVKRGGRGAKASRG